jgi:Mg2+ and Co2+ transporter CorA
MYEGRDTWIIVQSFGYPTASCPAVDGKLQEKLSKLDRTLTIYGAIAEMREKIVEKNQGTLEERKAQVDSYNTAARLYNKTVDSYKEVVEEYNDEVGKFNSCVKKVAAKMEH